MKHLGFFFTLLVLSVCRKKMKAREPSLRLSVFNELREEAERERFVEVFFLTRVTNIAFLIFFYYLRRKIRQKNTHTRRKNKQMLFSY